MSIFDSKMHDTNCLVFIDREWSTSEVSGMRARFADGPFELDYYGTDVEFIKHFKERFKSFYEKVLRDYDEALGYDKPTYEDCFDTMVADMTLIDYKPYFKMPKPFVSSPSLITSLGVACIQLEALKRNTSSVSLKYIFNELYKEEK